jgi:hypothetical protein
MDATTRTLPSTRVLLGFLLPPAAVITILAVTGLPDGDERDDAAYALHQAAVACKDADPGRDTTLDLSPDGQTVTTHSTYGYRCLADHLDAPIDLGARILASGGLPIPQTVTHEALDWTWTYADTDPHPGTDLTVTITPQED